MNIDDMTTSKYLKQSDCEPPILVTITHLKEVDVSKESDPESLRWCIYFQDMDKPLVSNQTNRELIAAIVGSRDTDNWIGKEIVLYNDPSIMFAGKITGGIRVRARNIQPETQPVSPPGNALPPVGEQVDEIPF